MIENLLKNFCLITFALIGPISLPAGGIQRSINEYKSLNNAKEIILTTNHAMYSFPKVNAKKLLILKSGHSLSILRKWQISEKDIWLRVELATNQLLDDPNKIIKGWIKM